MYQLKQVPAAIQVDYGIACQFPDTVFKDFVLMAEERWDKALILAIAYAAGAGKTIPMTPAKSLHFFQKSSQLTYGLDQNAGSLASSAIAIVFGQVMNDVGLKQHFCKAILKDTQLTPKAKQRLGFAEEFQVSFGY